MKYNELISFDDCLALQSKNYAWLLLRIVLSVLTDQGPYSQNILSYH